MNTRVLQDAIHQADNRAERTGEDCTVYYQAGSDRYGRTGVFYVRSASEGPPEYGGEFVTAYRTALQRKAIGQ
jgi:hypothetical protein